MRTDTVIGKLYIYITILILIISITGHGSSYANVGFDNLFDRSNDGRIV